MTKIVRDDPEGPGPASSRLAAIIAKCLKKNPDERYASAADLAADLDAGVPTEKTAAYAATRRRLVPLAAGGLAVILGLIVALGVFRDSPQDEAPVSSPAPAVIGSKDEAPVSSPAPAVTGSEDEAPVSSPAPAVTGSENEAPVSSPAPAVTEDRPADPPPAPATRSAADRFFAEGLTELQAGRTREARSGFDSAYRIDPSHQKAILGLAIADRRWVRARELAREIEAQHPDDPDVETLRRILRESEAERRDGDRRRVRTAPTRD